MSKHQHTPARAAPLTQLGRLSHVQTKQWLPSVLWATGCIQLWQGISAVVAAHAWVLPLLECKRWLWRLVFVIAMGLCGDGLWLQAKAWLAQLLIAQAWQQSIATQQVVKPWPWADTWPVARLQSPQQAVDLYVLDGAHGSALAFGPGRMHGTADPGLPGLSIIGGHRDTHFRFLRELQLGALLVLTDQQGQQHQYRVDDLAIVDSRTTPLVAAGDENRLLLITCYPFDAWQPGGDLRYVVSAQRVPAVEP